MQELKLYKYYYHVTPYVCLPDNYLHHQSPPSLPPSSPPHSSLHPFPPTLPFFRPIPVASPHRRWCNPPTPARNHKVWSWLARQARGVAGQRSPALAKEKQQEGRKEERGEVKVGGCSGRRASRASEGGKQRGLSEMAAVEGGKERKRRRRGRKRREKKNIQRGKKKVKGAVLWRVQQSYGVNMFFSFEEPEEGSASLFSPSGWNHLNVILRDENNKHHHR